MSGSDFLDAKRKCITHENLTEGITIPIDVMMIQIQTMVLKKKSSESALNQAKTMKYEN